MPAPSAIKPAMGIAPWLPSAANECMTGKGSSVGLGVGVGVSVGVLVGVAVWVELGSTNPVGLGKTVDDACNVTAASTIPPTVVAVQVGGSIRGVSVAVGRTSVGGNPGGGKGFIDVFGLINIAMYIVNRAAPASKDSTARMFQMGRCIVVYAFPSAGAVE